MFVEWQTADMFAVSFSFPYTNKRECGCACNRENEERDIDNNNKKKIEEKEILPYILRFYHILLALYGLTVVTATVATILEAVCFFPL